MENRNRFIQNIARANPLLGAGTAVGSFFANRKKRREANTPSSNNPSATSGVQVSNPQPREEFKNNLETSAPAPTNTPVATTQQSTTNRQQYNIPAPPVGVPQTQTQAPSRETPVQQQKSQPQSAYLRYLTGMGDFNEDTATQARKEYEQKMLELADVENRYEAKNLESRRGYEEILDRSGGLKSGAQASASMFSRRSNQELADIALQKSAAARVAQVAQDTYSAYINAGKTSYEAEMAAQQAERDQEYKEQQLAISGQYTLGEGSTRFDAEGNRIAYGGAKTYAPSSSSSGGTPTGFPTQNEFGQMVQATTPSKAPTQGERGSFTYFQRMGGAVENIDNVLENTDLDLKDTLKLQTIPNLFLSTELQQLKQAQREFTEARLRKDSGAAIPPSEFKNDAKTYFPQPGDSPQTLQQKAEARQRALGALRLSSGNAYWDFYGQNPNQVGQQIIQGNTSGAEGGNQSSGDDSYDAYLQAIGA